MRPDLGSPGVTKGRAVVYEGSPDGLAPPQAWAWAAEGNHFNALYGSSVAGAGDVNGDGYADVIVGAPGYSVGQDDEGRAFVYHGAPTFAGWDLAGHLGFAPNEIAPGGQWQVQSWNEVGQDWFPLHISETPDVVTYGSVPQSILITTGRVVDGEIVDTDWGDDAGPDTGHDLVTLELALHVPPWAETLRFTTQFLTEETDPLNPDNAKVRFYLDGWAEDWFDLNAWHLANKPVSHCINVAGNSLVKLLFRVEDVNNIEDPGMLISRAFFSELPFPPDLVEDGVDANGDGVVDFIDNPTPSDVSRSAGSYTYARSLFSIPGKTLPFDLSIFYSSESLASGSLGRKWTHSYDNYVRTLADGTVLVRHGNGLVAYLKPDRRCVGGPLSDEPCQEDADCPGSTCGTAGGGFRAKYPGIYSRLSGGPDDFTLVAKNHATYKYEEQDGENFVSRLTEVTDPSGNSFTLAYVDVNGVRQVEAVTDTRGETIQFSYANGRLASVSYGPSTVVFNHDPAHDSLGSFTDPDGETTTSFAYDDLGNLTTVTDPDGVVVAENRYEQYQGIDLLQVGNRVLSRAGAADDPSDPSQAVRFDYVRETVRRTDRLGRQDARLYDVKGPAGPTHRPRGRRLGLRLRPQRRPDDHPAQAPHRGRRAAHDVGGGLRRPGQPRSCRAPSPVSVSAAIRF